MTVSTAKTRQLWKLTGFCRFIVIKGMRVKVLHPGIPEVQLLYEGGR